MPNRLTPTSDAKEQVRAGATLAALREARAIRLGELAETLQISHSYLSNIENGRRALTPQLAARAAKALQVRPIALLNPGAFAETPT